MPFDRLRGFATNVANYQALGVMCPWEPDQGYRNGYCLNNKHQSDPCCADACKLESQWNPANNEHNYAQALVKAAKGKFSWDARAIIDTGRNGVTDMRQDCQNWCNIRGAGAGLRSTATTSSPDMIDAYFWLKTPGESDGCSQTLPTGEACPRYDSMCGSVDALGQGPGEPPAPEAGAWFDYQVKQLAENAHLGPPTPSPEPTPTPTPTPSPTPSPSPVPGCPGGSLSSCIGMCPAAPADAYKFCVDSCVSRCSSSISV